MAANLFFYSTQDKEKEAETTKDSTEEPVKVTKF